MNNKPDDDGFSIANVSLLDENISHSSPRNLTSSPAPINNNIRSSKNRRYSTANVESLDEHENYATNDKDPRANTTSLKSQESVRATFFFRYLYIYLSFDLLIYT